MFTCIEVTVPEVALVVNQTKLFAAIEAFAIVEDVPVVVLVTVFALTLVTVAVERSDPLDIENVTLGVVPVNTTLTLLIVIAEVV